MTGRTGAAGAALLAAPEAGRLQRAEERWLDAARARLRAADRPRRTASEAAERRR